MEQLVRVHKCNDDGTATVIHIRESACSGDCHKCSGCGAVQQEMLLQANNPIYAQPGQVVILRTESGPVLAAAAVLYILPLILLIAGYLVFSVLWSLGGLGSCVGLALGIALAVAYDRLVVRKQKTVYTITGFAKMPDSVEKGDNDLD